MRIRGASVLTLLAVLLLCFVDAFAQTTAADQLKIKIKGLADDIKAKQSRQDKTIAFGVRQNIDTFALALALRKSQAAFVVQAEDVRVDKQVGSSDNSAGATSLTSKGSVPAILGFAVENGALTRTTSGTTVTFRGNPVGIIKALGNAGFVRSYQEDDASTRFLRRFSFAVSFDTSRETGQSASSQTGNAFTGDSQQLSSYAFRLDLLNKRDPRDSAYQGRWNKLIEGDLVETNSRLAKIGPFLLDDPAFVDWHRKATDAIAAAAPEDVATVLEQQLDKLRELELSAPAEANIDTFIKAFNAYLKGRDEILDVVAKGPIITFEYATIRRVDAVDLSNFKLIAEGALFRGRADLTANASLTILTKIPAGSTLDRIRDVDLSGQLDVLLGEVQKVGSIVLSFSGKYKRVMQDTMMAGGMMADTKGDIGVGQVKLTIPAKGSGVRIPISVTFANRTELIKEKIVRGNIGITFDLDLIFARFKP